MEAHQVAAGPMIVTVALYSSGGTDNGSRIRTADKSTKSTHKPQREYHFCIQVDSQVVGVMEWASFSEIRNKMLPFQSEKNKFPTRSFLGMADFVNNTANVQQRAADIAKFMQGLLTDDQHFAAAGFHVALGLDAATSTGCVQALCGVAAQRMAVVDAIRVQQQAYCNYAQNFNSVADMCW